MDIWSEVKKLKGCTLRTLDRGNRFDILDIDENTITVRPHATGKERVIPRKEIEDAFRELRAIGELSRSAIRERYSEANPAYVTTILAQIAGVQHTKRPIILRYRPEAGPKG